MSGIFSFCDDLFCRSENCLWDDFAEAFRHAAVIDCRLDDCVDLVEHNKFIGSQGKPACELGQVLDESQCQW